MSELVEFGADPKLAFDWRFNKCPSSETFYGLSCYKVPADERLKLRDRHQQADGLHFTNIRHPAQIIPAIAM
jgi:hypothetical protein